MSARAEATQAPNTGLERTLGVICRNQGLAEQALALRRGLGMHPDLGETAHNLGSVYVSLDQLAEAEHVLVAAHQVLIDHTGRGSRPVTMAREALATLHEALGNPEQAAARRQPLD